MCYASNRREFGERITDTETMAAIEKKLSFGSHLRLGCYSNLSCHFALYVCYLVCGRPWQECDECGGAFWPPRLWASVGVAWSSLTSNQTPTQFGERIRTKGRISVSSAQKYLALAHRTLTHGVLSNVIMRSVFSFGTNN